MNRNYNIVFITITILSVIISSTAIMSESFALNPASKKLNDRTNALDKEAEQAGELLTVFKNGKLIREDSLAEIRKRLLINKEEVLELSDKETEKQIGIQ